MADDDTGRWLTRGFQAGAFAFRVATTSDRWRRTIDELFADLGVAADAPIIYDVTDAGDQAKLDGAYCDGVFVTPDAVLSDLVTSVNRMSLDTEPDRLHLHAGCVERDGVGVLISGASGAGKSTLIASLALRGWAYLSDEAVSIAVDDPLVRGFPKPLSIKPTGHHLLPSLAAKAVWPDSSDASGIWQVPVGRSCTEAAVHPKVVVLLGAGKEQHPTLRRVAPEDAVVAIAEQTLDFARYGTNGLLAIAQLVSQCRVVGLDVGGPAEALAGLIEDQAAGVNDSNPVVEAISSAPPTSGVRIGEALVLMNAETGVVAAVPASSAGDVMRYACGGAEPTDATISYLRQEGLLPTQATRPTGGSSRRSSR